MVVKIWAENERVFFRDFDDNFNFEDITKNLRENSPKNAEAFEVWYLKVCELEKLALNIND